MGEDDFSKNVSAADSQPANKSINPKELRWAVIRLILGIVQMVGATISLLLIQTGVSTATIGTCVATTFFTIMNCLEPSPLIGDCSYGGPP